MPVVGEFRIPFFKVAKPTGSISSILFLALGFILLILIGTILLMLPVSSVSRTATSMITALFTATSAVCVTGLVVVDTGTYWSTFGQGVLLALFQIGGFGFITGATLLLLTINRRFGLKERLAIVEVMGTDRLEGALGLVVKIAIFSLVVEGIGAGIFYFYWLSTGNPSSSFWPAIFHSVSAFNNCGMDILGNFQSLSVYREDTLVLLVTAGLIIIGSTGFGVFADVFRKWSFRKLTLDTKIILVTTLALIILGSLFILGTEYANSATLGQMSFPHKALVAFFQAVSPRTAGFTAIDIANFKQITLFFMMFLMFVGGAVGSTAGGVKVNTLGVLFLTVRSLIRGRTQVEAFERRIPQETVNRAITLFLLYLFTASVIVLVLSFTETFPIEKILFETFSALSTVGLSTGITPDLSLPGRIIITAAMFLGRLGPLALMAFLSHHRIRDDIEYPHDSIRLG